MDGKVLRYVATAYADATAREVGLVSVELSRAPKAEERHHQ